MAAHVQLTMSKGRSRADDRPARHDRRRQSRLPGLGTLIGRYMPRQSKEVRIAILLPVFWLVTLIDVALDPSLSLYALYLVPALCATWLLGARWGYFACAVSAAVWVFDDITQNLAYRHTLIPYGNLAARAAVLAAIIALVNLLKSTRAAHQTRSPRADPTVAVRGC